MTSQRLVLAILAISFLARAHGEDKHGPNGGYIRMPGPFHTEVIESPKGTLKVFLLDHKFEDPTITDSEVSAAIIKGKTKTTLACSPKENHFVCQLPKGSDLKAGVLELTATRDTFKGNAATYKLPLQLEKTQ